MFTIDPKLENDSILAALCGGVQVRLMRDSRYFWVILVPQVEGASEWHDLEDDMAHHVATFDRRAPSALWASSRAQGILYKSNSQKIKESIRRFVDGELLD